MHQFQATIDSWAEATSAGQLEAANAVALQALQLAGEHALKHPTPSLLLKLEAEDLEGKGDWAAAEAVRRQVLVLEESGGNSGMIAKAQMDLSQLLQMVGRGAEALQVATTATASARRTEMYPLIYQALEREARAALDQGDLPQALAATAEALQIIEPGKLTEGMRARALTARARCLLANHDFTGADLHLSLSWELLQLHAGTRLLPGMIATFAHWWEVKSQLGEQQGDGDGARAAIIQAIDFRRQCQGPYALCALARALDRLASISSATGDFVVEQQARNEARSLRNDLKLVADD